MEAPTKRPVATVGRKKYGVVAQELFKPNPEHNQPFEAFAFGFEAAGLEADALAEVARAGFAVAAVVFFFMAIVSVSPFLLACDEPHEPRA